jgi:hypothetical protein
LVLPDPLDVAIGVVPGLGVADVVVPGVDMINYCVLSLWHSLVKS